jgi:hypothetical protein
MSKKKHKMANTSFLVNFRLLENTEDFWFEKLLKERKGQIMEMSKNGEFINITYPINGNTYILEFNGQDKFSMSGCAWLAWYFMNQGCRIFGAKDRIFVNTSMSYCELGEVINELMPKMTDDSKFWGMVKQYEKCQAMEAIGGVIYA